MRRAAQQAAREGTITEPGIYDIAAAECFVQ